MTAGIVTVFGLFCIWFGVTGRGTALMGQTLIDLFQGNSPAQKSPNTNAPAPSNNTNT